MQKFTGQIKTKSAIGAIYARNIITWTESRISYFIGEIGTVIQMIKITIDCEKLLKELREIRYVINRKRKAKILDHNVDKYRYFIMMNGERL